jgi:hypothetical protein
MKKRYLNVAAAAYIVFAILVAHTSLASIETMAQANTHQRDVVGAAPDPVPNYQRLDFTHSVSVDKTLKYYEVRVWTANWCSGCQKWKREQYPKLKKAKIKVKFVDCDKKPPPKDVKSIPTIQILYKGKVIRTKVYWKADDILKFLKGRTSLKKG